MASKISAASPLFLASGSPRRRELLERVGIALFTRPQRVDETSAPGETPERYLERIVSAKLIAAAADPSPRAAVLVADTIVVEGGAILGKPEADDVAAAMLDRLAGKMHEVSTRYAVAAGDADAGTADVDDGVAETVTTRVWFRSLDPEQIARYVATGEGRDKAGGYGIQGIGAMLVERIEGDYSNVVGLPVCAVVMTLQRLGLIGACPPV